MVQRLAGGCSVATVATAQDVSPKPCGSGATATLPKARSAWPIVRRDRTAARAGSPRRSRPRSSRYGRAGTMARAAGAGLAITGIAAGRSAADAAEPPPRNDPR